MGTQKRKRNVNDRSISNIKKVDGVLKKNTDIRNKLIILKDTYAQYKNDIYPLMGQYYQIQTKDVKSMTDNLGLLAYTYGDKPDYEVTSRHKNFYYYANGEQDRPFSVNDSFSINMQRWGGSFEDYRLYIDDLFASNQSNAFTFINGIMANVKTEYALRETEVGVVKDLRVAEALNGEITTNPDGYKRGFTNLGNWVLNGINSATKGSISGQQALVSEASDTRLGIITSQLYSQALYNGAKFNSTRGRDKISSGHPYITPTLFGLYGNNLQTIFRLSDILRIDQRTGRTRDELGIDTKIIHLEDIITSDNDGVISLDYEKAYDAFGSTSTIPTVIEQIENQAEGVYNTLYSEFDDKRLNVAHSTYHPGKIYGTYDREKANYRENGKSGSVAARVTHEIYDDSNQDNESFKGYIDALSGEFDTYTVVNKAYNRLINKTDRLFMSHKLKTMVGRYYTGVDREIENNTIDTQWHDVFGRGKGRTLLTLKAQDNPNESTTSVYQNPYCRAWTYHRQYSRYRDAIRPFTGLSGDTVVVKDIRDDELVKKYRARVTDGNGGYIDSEGGAQYLIKNSVLQKNGMTKITPYSAENEDIKRCMFSIENLAWKDYSRKGNSLSSEQIGPNQGRIMWFPPYDLDFQENVTVDWSANSFIGRGEKVYTYSNTDRTGQLSFTLLIDHPSVVNAVDEKDKQSQNGTIDDDILRFYAGCQPLIVKDDVQDENGDDQNPIRPIQEIPGDGKEIKFAVFFPNNYSGNRNYIGDERVQQGQWETKGYLDDDWWKYLLFGKNLTVPSDDSEFCGYEMSANGISSVDGENFNWARNYGTKGSGNWYYGTELSETEKIQKPYRKFYYRVDMDLRQPGLIQSSYTDTSSYYMNSKLDKPSTEYGATYTFAEVFAAIFNSQLSDGEKNFIKGINSDSEGKITELSDLFSNGQVSSIKVDGVATNQDSKNTDKLANRRAKCVGSTLKEALNFSGNVEFGTKESSVSEGNMEINTPDPKLQRCAIVTIVLNNPTVSNAGNIDDEQATNSDVNDGNQNADGSMITSMDSQGNQVTYLRTLNVRADANDEMSKIRYANEYQFFKELDVNDPVLYKSIKDKYRYFDPAFHSMTPEGFNERLNFLHQCTRQGHTVSASDLSDYANTAPTAGNLSFGRMPVCVLRIGDFIYSRIIIQSMNMTYSSDGMQWDLNPEGIGVQPMYANVSMGIVLLGGQALNMPINRLQNAQTFDYYANSGVYDNRSDRVEIDNGTGKLIYKKLYTPSK